MGCFLFLLGQEKKNKMDSFPEVVDPKIYEVWVFDDGNQYLNHIDIPNEWRIVARLQGKARLENARIAHTVLSISEWKLIPRL